MRIGIALEETWSFLHEIYADLKEHHQVTLFKRRHLSLPIFETRVNRRLFHADLNAFMKAHDVVFFEWASELLATATHLPKQCGIVTRLHRYELYEWADRINWHAVDKIILISQTKKAEFLERFPEQASKVEVIFVGVDVEKFQSISRPFQGNLGILCHLTPRKRVYELILAFSELLAEMPDLKLHIGGGPHIAYGDYNEALHYLVRQLGIEDKVFFYGNVTETWKWYQEIDIFISNSYSEGLQVAPMEAMASGCYCLSHFWYGADELLPEQYLYYTDRQLQEKIRSYYHASESVKQEQQAFMRSIVCDRFNIHRTKIGVRQLIEDVGGASATRQSSPEQQASSIEHDKRVHS